MKRVSFYANSNKSNNLLHIETDFGIVNIRVGLIDRNLRPVTSIEIIPDKYSGERQIKLSGSNNNRLIQLKKKNK